MAARFAPVHAFRLLILMALAACRPGPARTAPLSVNCQSVNAITQVTGECERTLATLTAPQTEQIAVRTADVQPYATVDYEVTVESGSVIVIFSDVGQSEVTAQAAPGQPARGQARVRLGLLNQITFGLAPVNGSASGVTYRVKFVCDCLP
jgi:hypothetical protein